MSRSILAAVIFGLMLVTGSLFGQNAPEPTMSNELPDVTLPPELDRVLRDYERAWRAGDAAALASLFAEDGFALQNSSPPIRGRPAIQAAYESQGAVRCGYARSHLLTATRLATSSVRTVTAVRPATLESSPLPCVARPANRG